MHCAAAPSPLVVVEVNLLKGAVDARALATSRQPAEPSPLERKLSERSLVCP